MFAQSRLSSYVLPKETMKRIAAIAIILSAMSLLSQAKDGDPAVEGPLTAGSATRAAKAHVRSFLEGDFKKMKTTYAAKVKLMPGGEMLKAEYGLAGANGLTKAMMVDRAKLIAAMEKAFGGRPIVEAENIEKIFKMFNFEILKTGLGDFAVDPPDPVDTPDKKLHFAIEEGDVLFKVGPEKGDFLLFQFRPIGGRWLVVAEYLD